MVRSGPGGKSPSSRIGRRLGPALILAGLFLMLFWLGLKGVRAYRAARQGMEHLAALQESLDRPPQELLTDFSQLKAQVDGAARELAALRAEVHFFDPLLSRLAWIPRYGPELAAAPHLTAMAADLTSAAADLAEAISPTLPILDEGREDSLARAIEALQQKNALLERAHARLQHAAYERTFLDPTLLNDGPFADVGPLLDRLDPMLPSAVRALGMLEALLPQADAMLGMDAPRRYLLLGQNNFELRATGGFLGSMGIMTVERGRISNLDYRRSYDWDNPNREKMQPPFPYVRYMAFGAWFIRDANWYADFPTSAQTVEMFWQKDGHDPVEGVIAADLYAVQALLEVAGPLEVPGYGVTVGRAGALETIWEGYRQDPNFLSALTEAVATRLQQPDLFESNRVPALLQALGRCLEEKHILLYFNAADLQEAVARAGWGGAIRGDPGDFIMVVDSDFSYAEVNRFIEQEIRYRVTLDHSLKVQESRLTLTYWNHFDRWSSAETRELFGGACFDPQTEELKHSPGCYGDYIRIFVPRGSRFVSAEGFDDGMEYREEAGRTVIAGYVRVLPGEQRSVTVTYVPPAGAVGGEYRLTLQKQPGTDALPVAVEIRVTGSTPAEVGLETNLRLDRTVAAMWQEGQLLLSGEGPLQARLDPQRQARQKGFAEGLALWEAGRPEEAVERWRKPPVTELVLDRANLLLSRGDLDEAGRLCGAALELDPSSARAYFLRGKVAMERGNAAEAGVAWEKAVALDPLNFAAQLELGLFYEASGDLERAYAHLQYADRKEATQALWQRVWPYFNTDNAPAGFAALGLIIRIDPNDANARFVLAERLRVDKQYEQALAAYQEAQRVAPADVRFYIGRAQVYADQGQGDPAIADLEEAVRVAPRSAEAWFYLGLYRWRFRRDAGGATQALQQALALNPIAWYATELGNVYLQAGDLEAAVKTHERAVTLPGHGAYTWWSLGDAYAAQGQWEQAASAYGQAVALEPEAAWLHARLANAYERAGHKAEAIAEYEAALALEPGQAQWQKALDRLRGS